METDVLSWLLNQSAAIVAFALVAWYNRKQAERLAANQERMINECWSKILALLDSRK